ncbi:hypothetical protein DIPPA_16015 [Diplonema papillatum]|nr:hypothetical protein DIPPA_16015 [Diplonema papillatum]
MMTAPALLGMLLLATPGLAAYTVASAELEDYSSRPEFSPFVVRDVDGASGGKVVVLPETVPVYWEAKDLTNRLVKVLFTTTRFARVHVRVRAYFPTDDSSSFVYRLDDDITYHVQDWSPIRVWDIFGRTFPFVEAGAHVMTIIAREPGSLLDKVDFEVTDGEVFHDGPLLAVELETLATQGAFAPFAVETYTNGTGGGEYIVLPSGAAAQLDPAAGTAGQVEIAFSLTETTDVSLTLRVSIPAAGGGSFYCKLDGGAFETVASGATAGWVTLAARDYAQVAAGGHVLVIKAREPGAMLDSASLLAAAGGVSPVREVTPQPPPAPPTPQPTEATLPPFVVTPVPEHAAAQVSAAMLALFCVGAALL